MFPAFHFYTLLDCTFDSLDCKPFPENSVSSLGGKKKKTFGCFNYDERTLLMMAKSSLDNMLLSEWDYSAKGADGSFQKYIIQPFDQIHDPTTVLKGTAAPLGVFQGWRVIWGGSGAIHYTARDQV